MDDSTSDSNIHLSLSVRECANKFNIVWSHCTGRNTLSLISHKPLFYCCSLQVAHLALLSNFPFFSVSSPAFVMAVVMVLVNHYLAFSHFGEKYYPFSEVGNNNGWSLMDLI